MFGIASKPEPLVKPLRALHRRACVEADASAPAGAGFLNTTSDKRLANARAAHIRRNAEHANRRSVRIIHFAKCRIAEGHGDATDDSTVEHRDEYISRPSPTSNVAKCRLVEFVTDVAKRPIRLYHELAGTIMLVDCDRTNLQIGHASTLIHADQAKLRRTSAGEIADHWWLRAPVSRPGSGVICEH